MPIKHVGSYDKPSLLVRAYGLPQQPFLRLPNRHLRSPRRNLRPNPATPSNSMTTSPSNRGVDAVRRQVTLAPMARDVTCSDRPRTVYGADGGRRLSYAGKFRFLDAAITTRPITTKSFAYLIDCDNAVATLSLPPYLLHCKICLPGHGRIRYIKKMLKPLPNDGQSSGSTVLTNIVWQRRRPLRPCWGLCSWRFFSFLRSSSGDQM